MYHAVGTRTHEQDPDNLFVTESSFRLQLDALARRRLRPVGLDEYIAGRTGSGDVLLTFDDAYESVLSVAAPLLAERGWAATVYVCSRALGGTSHWNTIPDEPLLAADGVHELVKLGWSVGAHGQNHVDLRGLDAEVLWREIQGSREELGELLGEVPTTFAYPYGAHDAASRAAVGAAGFSLGFAVHDGRGRYAVPRVDVNARDTPRSFAAKLHPGYPALRRALGLAPPLRRAAHRVAGLAQR